MAFNILKGLSKGLLAYGETQLETNRKNEFAEAQMLREKSLAERKAELEDAAAEKQRSFLAEESKLGREHDVTMETGRQTFEAAQTERKMTHDINLANLNNEEALKRLDIQYENARKVEALSNTNALDRIKQEIKLKLEALPDETKKKIEAQAQIDKADAETSFDTVAAKNNWGKDSAEYRKYKDIYISQTVADQAYRRVNKDSVLSPESSAKTTAAAIKSVDEEIANNRQLFEAEAQEKGKTLEEYRLEKISETAALAAHVTKETGKGTFESMLKGPDKSELTTLEIKNLNNLTESQKEGLRNDPNTPERVKKYLGPSPNRKSNNGSTDTTELDTYEKLGLKVTPSQMKQFGRGFLEQGAKNWYNIIK